MTATAVPEPGFADQALGAQETFRALLDALATPTRPMQVDVAVGSPEPLTTAAAAIVLTLCDDATPLWLDPVLRVGHPAVEAWLRFHTGAPIVESPGDAEFAIVSSPSALPALEAFSLGTDEAPHTSGTVIVVDADGGAGRSYRTDGPGFERASTWRAPAFPAEFTAWWAANSAGFPRGVDLVIAGRDTVVGLPRTTRLTEDH
jgi:alpha-D-ribose 1-methylphosphonate 5-triphosphate synthase subunit PhnH